MAPPDGLDRALRDALGSGPHAAGASPEARSRLLAELRRRRARRARAIGGGVVGAVAVAGLAVTLGTSLTAGPPPQSAVGAPEQRAAAGSASGSAKRAATSYTPHESPALDAPAGSPAGQSAPGVPCAELRIGSGPLTCMGTSARTVTMHVGQHLTLVLPGNRTLRWTAPAIAPATGAVGGSPTYAGAAPTARAAQSRRALAGAKAVLAPVPGAAHPRGGSAGASFVARHRGEVVLYADASTGCGGTGTGPPPPIACVPEVRRWSVVLIVKGN